MSAEAISTMGNVSAGNVSASHPRAMPASAADTGNRRGESPGTLSFGDFLDVINPLQHIPVISTIYRRITGDEIDPEARLAGGALYGGPLGFVSALANVIVEEQTGRDIGETVSVALLGEDETPNETRPAIGRTDIAWQNPRPGTQTGIGGRYRATAESGDDGRIAWFGPRITERVELADANAPAAKTQRAGAASGSGTPATANLQKAAAAYRKTDDFAYMDERFDR